jgi:hypothetical protein
MKSESCFEWLSTYSTERDWLVIGIKGPRINIHQRKAICNAGYACNCEKLHIVNCKHGHNSDRLDKRGQESFGHDIAN